MIKNNSGFTIVEALFAISILTFTITGLMTIVANSLFSARFAKDELTVNYLLQEAVDYIRNDRDTSMFLKKENEETFLQDYSNCIEPNNGCYFDVPEMMGGEKQSITACSSDGVCEPFYYDKNKISYDGKPFYISYTRGLNTSEMLKTSFRRKIVITTTLSNEIQVKVTVNWVNGGLSMERSLSTSLLNWNL